LGTHNIEIDSSKQCNRCGESGAAFGEGKTRGLCLACINKDLKAELKKDRITTEILQEMAGDIEKMLIEEQQQIEWAFRNVQDGFKLSISVNIEHTIPPTAEYNISYPLEPAREPIQKQKVTLKKVIGQGELEV